MEPLLKAASDLVVLAKQLPAVLAELRALKERVTELERILAGPPCPKCNMPGWHEEASEPTKGEGKEFGLLDVTFACLRCGHTKTVPAG